MKVQSLIAVFVFGAMACGGNGGTGAGGGGASGSGSGSNTTGNSTQSGHPTSSGTQGTGASSASSGTGGGCPDPKQCGAPLQCAPLFTGQIVASDPPAPGNTGTVPDGTYFETAANVYTGPTGTSGPSATQSGGTFVLTGGTFTSSTTNVDGAGKKSTIGAAGTVVFGVGGSLEETCPVNDAGAVSLPMSYTLDSDGTLHLFISVSGITAESVFSPQP